MNQPHFYSLSDDSYLDVTDINLLLKHLMHQVLIQKPDNPIEFSRNYFQRVQSCHHVIGTDYAFISACQHNRRAFVFCCMESFQNFSPLDELSSYDYHQLLQMICSDIPLSLVEQATEIIDPIHSLSDPARYTYHDLMLSLFFHIIYHDWLKELQKMFSQESGSSSDMINVNRLQSKILAWQTELPDSLQARMPSQETIDTAATNLAIISSKGSDISIKQWKRALLQCQSLQEDICTKPKKAESFSTALLL